MSMEQTYTNFSKNLGGASKFWVPEGRHEASSIVGLHKYQAKKYKILWPGRPGYRDLCTPDVERWCQYSDRAEDKVFGDKLVPLPLRQPQIPHCTGIYFTFLMPVPCVLEPFRLF